MLHASSPNTKTRPARARQNNAFAYSIALKFNQLSGSRLNRLGRPWMMAMTVFSLKPARTSLTTDVFVSGASGNCWALRDTDAVKQDAAITIDLIRTFFIRRRYSPASTYKDAPTTLRQRWLSRFARARQASHCDNDSLFASHLASFAIGRHFATKLHDGAPPRCSSLRPNQCGR